MWAMLIDSNGHNGQRRFAEKFAGWLSITPSL